MALYVVLIRAPGSGSGLMLYSHVLGAEQQKDAIKILGGEVIGQYAVLGQYDEVLIVDFPDSETALAFNLLSNSEGLYAESMRAFRPEDVAKAKERADLLFPPHESDEEENAD
ncbi:MAG: GYD domain-containing protein [Chloroflexota bacterium]|nr:GYD domain-containing protein [Chloroflexota bacterium]MDQ5867726.1 GYD domain-containing protein [Chloroflexota bacterium]